MHSKDRGFRALFQERVDHWTRRTLLRPTAIRVRHMTRLWGICYPDGTITFSRALLDQPAAFQDLVIVHELIHLIIPNHGESFARALAVYLPDWRAIARLAPGTPAELMSSRMVRDTARLAQPRQLIPNGPLLQASGVVRCGGAFRGLAIDRTLELI